MIIGARKYWEKIGERGQSRVAALIDQLLLSLGTIIQTFVFVRTMPIDEFGRYATFLSFGFLSVGLQRSVLITPMVISIKNHRSAPHGWERISLFMSGLFAVFLLIASVICHIFVDSGFFSILLISSICMIPIMGCEFNRRRLILAMNFEKMLQARVIFFLLSTGSVIVSAVFKFGFIGAALMASLSYFSSFYYYRNTGRDESKLGEGEAFAALRENIKLIAWNTAAALPYMVFNNGMPVLIGATLGASTVGVFSSTRIFMSPATMLIQAIDSVDKPAAGRALRARGTRAMLESLIGTMRTLSFLIIPYVALVFAFPHDAIRLALGPGFPGAPELIYGWLIVSVLMIISQPIESALLLTRRLNIYFVSRLIAAAVSVFLVATNFSGDSAVSAVGAVVIAWACSFGFVAAGAGIVFFRSAGVEDAERA